MASCGESPHPQKDLQDEVQGLCNAFADSHGSCWVEGPNPNGASDHSERFSGWNFT